MASHLNGPPSLNASFPVGPCGVRLLAEGTGAARVARLLIRDLGGASAPPASADVVCRLASAPALPEPPAGSPHVEDVDGYALSVWSGAGAYVLRTASAEARVDVARGEARGVVCTGAAPGLDTHGVIRLALGLLLRGRGLLPLHAGALAHARGGVLVSAPSGSGKSTLTLALVREGWSFLSDDTVLLGDAPAGVTAYPFRRTFGLLPETLAWLPLPGSAAPRGGGKAAVPLAELLPAQAAAACRPALLLLPRLAAAAESRFEPLRAADALAELMPQSGLLTFERAWAADHLAALGRLVRQARPYRLWAGRDVLEGPAAVAARIASLLPPVDG